VATLAEAFVDRLNRQSSQHAKVLHPESYPVLNAYSWPGNVRELKNVIERAMILSEQEMITPKNLPFELKQTEKVPHVNSENQLFKITDEMSLEKMEKVHLAHVLNRLEWNKSKASKILGVSRATLRAKIKKYNLENN